MALGGHPKTWNKAPHLSEPYNWHTSWEWAYGGCLWGAQIQDMQVLVPTGDPVGIPGWDSSLGMLPPPPCPLPAPPWECQHLFIVPKIVLCLLFKEHKKKTFFPLKNGLGCPSSQIPSCAPPFHAGLGMGALLLKEYLQWFPSMPRGRAVARDGPSSLHP